MIQARWNTAASFPNTHTHIERERDGLKTDVCVMILGLFQNKRTNAN